MVRTGEQVFFYLFLLFFLSLGAAGSSRAASLPWLDVAVETTEKWQGFVRQWQGSEKPSLEVRFNGMPALMKFHGSHHTRNSSKKPAFRLHWTDAKGDRRILILKAGYFDHSRMREWLGLKMFAAAGILSPEAGLVRLVVDGEPLGVYLAITPVDARYVRNLHKTAGAEDALLYYGDPPPDRAASQPDLLPLDKPEHYKTAYTSVLTDADPNDLELSRLTMMLNAKPFDIFSLASHADIGEWSRWFAVSEIMENWDSPWHRRGNNYSLYRPPGGRWQILPWDPDHIYENKGLYFPVPKVKGVRGLLASPVFSRKVRLETWRLGHGKLSPERLLEWIKEAEQLISPVIDAGEEPGLDRRLWGAALESLKMNILMRHSRLEEVICPKGTCTDKTMTGISSPDIDGADRPVLW